MNLFQVAQIFPGPEEGLRACLVFQTLPAGLRKDIISPTHTAGFKETSPVAGSAQDNLSLLRLCAYLWEQGVWGESLAWVSGFPSLFCTWMSSLFVCLCLLEGKKEALTELGQTSFSAAGRLGEATRKEPRPFEVRPLLFFFTGCFFYFIIYFFFEFWQWVMLAQMEINSMNRRTKAL